MGILDEDISNFNGGFLRYEYYSDIIREYIPNSTILVLTCGNIPCHKCIGDKYNIKNGCPVCGEIFFSTAANGVRICLNCGSVVTLCGNGSFSGSISAVGIGSTVSVKTDDVI